MAVHMVKARFNSVIVPQLAVTGAGSLAVLVVAIALWVVGATSTVVLFTAVVQAIFGSAGAWGLWYIVGIVFSAIEIWDKRTSSTGEMKKAAAWITRADMLSTAVGLFIIIKSYLLPLFLTLCSNMGFTLVLTNATAAWAVPAVITVISIVIGRWLTLKPEEIGIEATVQLWEVLKYVYAAATGRSIAVADEAGQTNA